MFVFRYRALPIPVIFGVLLLTACSPGESTVEICQRLTVVQEDVAQFESSPTGDPAQRLETVRGFTRELNNIRADAGDPELELASDTLANLYGTIAHVAESNPLLTSAELLAEVGELLDVDRINEANAVYLRVCVAGE